MRAKLIISAMSAIIFTEYENLSDLVKATMQKNILYFICEVNLPNSRLF